MHTIERKETESDFEFHGHFLDGSYFIVIFKMLLETEEAKLNIGGLLNKFDALKEFREKK